MRIKTIYIDGVKMQVELICNVKPKDISTYVTGSNINIKTGIDKLK